MNCQVLEDLIKRKKGTLFLDTNFFYHEFLDERPNNSHHKANSNYLKYLNESPEKFSFCLSECENYLQLVMEFLWSSQREVFITGQIRDEIQTNLVSTTYLYDVIMVYETKYNNYSNLTQKQKCKIIKKLKWYGNQIDGILSGLDRDNRIIQSRTIQSPKQFCFEYSPYCNPEWSKADKNLVEEVYTYLTLHGKAGIILSADHHIEQIKNYHARKFEQLPELIVEKINNHYNLSLKDISHN